MVGICFAWDHRPHVRDHWSHLLSAFKVDEIWMRCPGGEADEVMGQKHGVVIQGFSDLPSDRTLAVMAPKDARDLTPVTTLGEYEHRGDEIYAFGHDHLYLYQSELEGLDHTVVTIPAPGCEMFSHQAAAIVLYDRMVRGG